MSELAKRGRSLMIIGKFEWISETSKKWIRNKENQFVSRNSNNKTSKWQIDQGQFIE